MLENISKSYYGNKTNGNNNNVNSSRRSSSTVLLEHIVLDNLNLRIIEGEFVTIVGPSGCGKSTLLNILAGIDTSYTGRILIDGAPIEKSPDIDRIIIFQEGALFPWLTVYENIEFGLKIAKFSKVKKKRNRNALYRFSSTDRFFKCIRSSTVWRYETKSSYC